MKVYRIAVDSWPTPDGQPWCRVYGPAYSFPVLNEIPDWLMGVISGQRSWRVTARVVYDDFTDEVSVVMPKPKRVNYLSASGVSELAENMRAFGAEVRIIESKPVEWDAAS